MKAKEIISEAHYKLRRWQGLKVHHLNTETNCVTLINPLDQSRIALHLFYRFEPIKLIKRSNFDLGNVENNIVIRNILTLNDWPKINVK